MYAKEGKSKVLMTRLAVSGVRFNRDMREIIESEDTIRTIIFPKTVRMVRQEAFFKNHELASAVANEGLEAIGTDEGNDDDAGAFEDSGLRKIKLSSTIKCIEYSAFKGCKELRDITLPDRLTYIGRKCF